MRSSDPVTAYVARLERVARVLPRKERTDLLRDIRAHLDASIPAEANDAEILNVLERLGDPEPIVSASVEASNHLGLGRREVFAVLGLLFGGLVFPFLGWLAGAGLMLSSRRWTTGQKVLAVAVVPGGAGSYVWVVGSIGFPVLALVAAAQVGVLAALVRATGPTLWVPGPTTRVN